MSPAGLAIVILIAAGVIALLTMPSVPVTFDVTTRSNVLYSDLYGLMQRKGHQPMANVAMAFVLAERDEHINALFLASVAALESAWGTSPLAGQTNNLFGWGAFDDHPEAEKCFETRGAGVAYVAAQLRRQYVDQGRLTIAEIGERYSTDPHWAQKVAEIMGELIRGL